MVPKFRPSIPGAEPYRVQEGVPQPPIFTLSAHLQNSDGARQLNVLLLIKLMERPICRQIGLERSLFVGKLGSNEVCLSANWARTKSVCREIGFIRSLPANWSCAK